MTGFPVAGLEYSGDVTVKILLRMKTVCVRQVFDALCRDDLRGEVVTYHPYVIWEMMRISDLRSRIL